MWRRLGFRVGCCDVRGFWNLVGQLRQKELERQQQWLFKSQGLTCQARLGREVGAEKASRSCKQLQSIHGLILWGCCVEPTPPSLAPPRCDLEPLAQDSLSLETR